MVRAGAFVLAIALASCAPQPLLHTNLCELAARGDELNGRLVRLTVIHQTDHMHSSVFYDPSCWDAGVADFHAESVFRDSARAREYWEASYRQSELDRASDAIDAPKDFRVEVTGIFRWVPNPENGIDFQDSHLRIYVTELHSFESVDHVYRNERERLFDRCVMSAIRSNVDPIERCAAEFGL